MRYPRAATVGVFLGAVVTGLAVCEALLRLSPAFAPSPRTFPGQHANRPGKHFVADTAIGWRMKMNEVFADTTPEFTVTYRADTNGFRNDRAPRNDTAARTIVFIGDSFTFGHGVDIDSSFGARIGHGLPAARVLNLAMPGFGLDQMWQTLRLHGLPARPALVVVAFVLDDFGRTLSAYRTDAGFNKPWFTLAEGQPVRAGAGDIPNTVVRALETHSRLWTGLARATRFAARKYPIGYWWRLNDAILQAIKDDCARAGVPVLFVHLPSRAPSQMPLLRRTLDTRNAHYLDLAGEHFPRGIPATYPVDGHLNATGHAYVAREILAWIAAHPGLLQ